MSRDLSDMGAAMLTALDALPQSLKGERRPSPDGMEIRLRCGLKITITHQNAGEFHDLIEEARS